MQVVVRVILVVLGILLAGFGLGVLFSVGAAYPEIFWSIVMLGAAIIFFSIHMVKQDVSLEVYLFGDRVGTFISEALYEALDEEQQKKVDAAKKVRHSTGILNWVGISGVHFFLFPFYTVYRFPPPAVKVMFHASEIFTDENTDEDLFRVRLEADPTMSISVMRLDYLLARALQNKPWQMLNFTRKCTIAHNDPPHHEYEGVVLARLLREDLKELVLEALRKSASPFFWGGGAKLDIVKAKALFELATLHELAQDMSLCHQAQILTRPKGFEKASFEDLRQAWEAGLLTLRDYIGDSAFSVDFNIENLSFGKVLPDTDEATKAINSPFIATREKERKIQEGKGDAKAAELAGAARAKVIALLKTELSSDEPSRYAAALEALSRISDVKIVQLGGDVKSLVENLIGRIP